MGKIDTLIRGKLPYHRHATSCKAKEKETSDMKFTTPEMTIHPSSSNHVPINLLIPTPCRPIYDTDSFWYMSHYLFSGERI